MIAATTEASRIILLERQGRYADQLAICCQLAETYWIVLPVKSVSSPLITAEVSNFKFTEGQNEKLEQSRGLKLIFIEKFTAVLPSHQMYNADFFIFSFV